MGASPAEPIPLPGEWPVDPQEDIPISKDRIWIDGCFDFSHHGKRIVFIIYVDGHYFADHSTCRPCWSDASGSETREGIGGGRPLRRGNS